MKTAILFAGQGAQYVGMGKDFYEEYEECREVYDNANVDFSLQNLWNLLRFLRIFVAKALFLYKVRRSGPS